MKLPVVIQNSYRMIRQAIAGYTKDNVPRLGAAMAYYTVFSIAPLLMIAIGIASLAFGRETAREQILSQMQDLVGPTGAKAIEAMLQNASSPSSGMIATIVGVITLLVGASGVFGELQASLNTIWDVPEREGGGLWRFVKDRFLSVLMVLGTGFLLLVSLILSTGLAAAGSFLLGVLPLPESVLHLLNFALSFGMITVLFALIYKLLPDTTIAWRDVWIGAVLTAFLFEVGKLLIGLYIGKANFASSYGAAGSLVIILVWVYYSTQILLFGAEFTEVYAKDYGSLASGRARDEKHRERASRAPLKATVKPKISAYQ
jgi:membrane protein